jgi:hypothetical protein
LRDLRAPGGLARATIRGNIRGNLQIVHSV